MESISKPELHPKNVCSSFRYYEAINQNETFIAEKFYHQCETLHINLQNKHQSLVNYERVLFLPKLLTNSLWH